MKKIIFLTIVLFSFAYSVNAAEKKDCSGIKKISKAYIACKSGNLKTDSKGIFGKVKNFGKKINKPFKKK